MKVTLIYLEKIEVDVPDFYTEKADAIDWAVANVKERGVQVYYHWYDAYVMGDA